MSGSVTGTNNGTTGTATNNSIAAGASSFGGDFNTFLTLLTTQLKNQDPTNAMDVSQMTQQLVAFAQVEQQISTNTNLDKLIGLQQATQLTAAAPLMGHTVEVTGNQLSLQDGRATLRLPAAGAATSALITITDGQGRTLRRATVALGTAPQDWQWDGRDSLGQRLPDGAYGFSVGGRDATGAAQTITVTAKATATAVERSNGELKLVLGGLAVGFDKVASVDAAQ
ncbi:MAG TPA: flagellar hook capping FlgD N-terminal domain-containing protein [Crenalkalicoccus sp.]|nr:flagellar hook capping FlgD N-terminal domain-containing protein [Crenalkalicoccus sp.]